MNIIYVGAFRLPNKDAAAARVLSNAKAMKALGHCITFISWGGEYRDEDLQSDGKYRVDGMEYIITREIDASGSFFNKLYSVFVRGKLSFELIKNAITKPDLIILYNADGGWTQKILGYCKSNGIKLANDITEWYSNNELHFWDIIPYYINMHYVQKKVKNKILISKYLCNYYDASNNVYLPPLCDQSEPKWSLNIKDERVPTFAGITLFYAGNPARKDCVHTVINVVNKLCHQGKKLRFIIAGPEKDVYINQYHDILDGGKLHDNIVFLGRVSQDSIPAYYKCADFMILLREPSRKNMAGFPTKFAESISSGIPVIANNTSDLDDYIVDNETGFIIPSQDADSLEKIIVDKVLNLSRNEIEKMKADTVAMKSVFDIRTYQTSINSFLSNLQ